MAEVSGWEWGKGSTVMKILGIGKAAPPCLQLWCSHCLLAVSLPALPTAFLPPPLPWALCVSAAQVENSHMNNSQIVGRACKAENAPS